MNAHRVHRDDSVFGDRLPCADFPKKRYVSGAQGVDARIETLGSNGRRALVRHQRDGQSARRAREACADRTAADDDEVVPPRVYNRVSIRGELAQLVRAAES